MPIWAWTTHGRKRAGVDQPLDRAAATLDRAENAFRRDHKAVVYALIVRGGGLRRFRVEDRGGGFVDRREPADDVGVRCPARIGAKVGGDMEHRGAAIEDRVVVALIQHVGGVELHLARGGLVDRTQVRGAVLAGRVAHTGSDGVSVFRKVLGDPGPNVARCSCHGNRSVGR